MKIQIKALSVNISIPENTEGVFKWKNKEYILKPGVNDFKIK